MPKAHHFSRVIIATLTVAASLLIAAAPAGAWLRDLSVVPVSTPSNSSSPKVQTITCPGGKVSLGAAAFTGPLLGNLALNRAAPPPNLGGTTAWVGAVETDSLSAAWALNGRAFCVTQTGTAPPAGGAGTYVKSVRIVREQSGLNSLSRKTVTANCPGGRTAIAGGGRVEGPFANLALTATQRVGNDRAWRVSAQEVDETGANWRLRTTAVCANVTTETATSDYAGPGFTAKDIVFPLGSGNLQSVAPGCPAGTFVVGGGAAVLGAPGQGPPNDVALLASEPPGGNPASAWLAIAQETDPTAAQWRIAARVLCAPLNGGPPA